MVVCREHVYLLQHFHDADIILETYRSRTNSLIAASSIRLKDRVYVVGGYDGTTYSEVVVISPKETFCQTAGTQMDCLQTTGCDFCVAEGIGKCVEKASDRLDHTKHVLKK